MLLIEYNPDDYKNHMYSWARWVENRGQVDPGQRKPETTTPVSKSSRVKKGFFPNGYDTDVAINAAVTSLGNNPSYAIHKKVIEVNFMTRLPPAEKAAAAGLSSADFRRKLTEGRKMIDQYMAGIANPLRYTYQARIEQ